VPFKHTPETVDVIARAEDRQTLFIILVLGVHVSKELIRAELAFSVILIKWHNTANSNIGVGGARR
jgi:hypothetical protein